MNLTVTTAPPFEPLSMTQAYNQLRLDPEGSPLAHPDDVAVVDAIAGAREHVEGLLNRTLVQRTLRLSQGGFPGQWSGPDAQVSRPLRLLRPPVVRVLSVQYFDSTNTLQAVDPADYYVTDEQVPQLRFVTGFAAPSVYDRPDAVRVEYLAGYTPDGSPPETQADYTANLPADVVSALKLVLADLYENRQGQTVGAAVQVNPAVKALLARHVVHVLA